jgi:hypothetical protein
VRSGIKRKRKRKSKSEHEAGNLQRMAGKGGLAAGS